MNELFQHAFLRSGNGNWVIVVGISFWSGKKFRPVSDEIAALLEAAYQKELKTNPPR